MSNKDKSKRKKWPDEDLPAAGLTCPACGCKHFIVDNTRKALKVIIRYRRCRNCGRRMTTRERAV